MAIHCTVDLRVSAPLLVGSFTLSQVRLDRCIICTRETCRDVDSTKAVRLFTICSLLHACILVLVLDCVDVMHAFWYLY